MTLAAEVDMRPTAAEVDAPAAAGDTHRAAVAAGMAAGRGAWSREQP